MNRILITEMVCIFLFLGMSLLSIVCCRLGRSRLQEEGFQTEVSSAIIGAVFALLGLLIAFTFSGAYSRFDVRRQLIVQEANAIGTAYLRLDLLPVASQTALREKFRAYAISRAALYERLNDDAAMREELARAGALQKEIWAYAIAGSADPQYQSARLLLLPALNEMIDIVTTRTVAIQTHPPLLIWAMLFVIALTCAGLTGYRAGVYKGRGYIYHILLAAIIACVLYVILDIEYPRSGLVRLDAVNRVLVNLAETIK
ncbi:MAG: DUF4239 domain-containing protein [Smithella sp.]